jgi:flagellar motor switch/type III secretory pathway protein FliN
MRARAGDVRPLRIPAVDAPGHLDRFAVRRWADLLVSECGSRLAESAALAGNNISCTGSILPSADYWQRPADATLLTVRWGAVTGSVAIPVSLALPLVARCLGYERTFSDLPPGPLDSEILGAWLAPVITWVEKRAGLDRVTVSPAAEREALWTEAVSLVLFQFSVSVGSQQGTWHLVIPWGPLRETLQREAVEVAERDRIEAADLRGIQTSADVIIAGGVVELRESFQFEVGDVVALDADVSSGVELRVGDRRVASARLGANKGRWAVRISEMDWAQM